MNKRILGGLAALLLTAGLAGAASAETIRVGVSAGPHAEILEQVKKVAAQDGLDIKIIEFTDYVVPNTALASGDIEANSFQHLPYLDNQVKDRGFKLVSVGQTVVFPMGFYSKKVKSFDELPEGATVAIQNDPTNGGRSLLLLQAKGVIKLRDGVGLKPTLLDIAENPKRLRLIELDAAQLPRSLDDVTAAAVNTNYAVEAGLDPVKDAIAREDAESPYTNIIAVREQDRDKPWVAALLKAYHTQPVKEFIQTRFKGAVVTSW
ncbi:MetQ/NlpA family ABC transporter substrate-binding protein [Oceanibaculum indicum]|uniref:D-methionine transport system substrate-binding protein n=1 Tax=Oceanibaculum indicum TaxID=526216 RepID=A0A420WN32_9PROT|nr:MetQ/NlpA family ABC transporter substrate-binding protein [Oceanibaculum indicum]RKQ72441.1 D-methionine transport system substrate-binding protein [Oceanibaculum indicum]